MSKTLCSTTVMKIPQVFNTCTQQDPVTKNFYHLIQSTRNPVCDHTPQSNIGLTWIMLIQLS